MTMSRKTRRPAPGRTTPAAYAASLSVSLAGALVLLFAPQIPTNALAQAVPPTSANAAATGSAAAPPPSAVLSGTMKLPAAQGGLPRIVPVTLTPQAGGGYLVRYEEKFRCSVSLRYNGFDAAAGHLYTASVTGIASGGTAAYCNSVGGKDKLVVLHPRADGQPGFTYDDRTSTGAKADLAPGAAKPAP